MNTIQTANFSDYIKPEKLSSDRIMIPIGVDAEGNLIEVDLVKHKNIVIDGAAGSGKSEWMKQALASVYTRYSNEEVAVFGEMEIDYHFPEHISQHFQEDTDKPWKCRKAIYFFDNTIYGRNTKRINELAQLNAFHRNKYSDSYLIVAAQDVRLLQLKYFPVKVGLFQHGSPIFQDSSLLKGKGDLFYSVNDSTPFRLQSLYLGGK